MMIATKKLQIRFSMECMCDTWRMWYVQTWELSTDCQVLESNKSHFGSKDVTFTSIGETCTSEIYENISMKTSKHCHFLFLKLQYLCSWLAKVRNSLLTEMFTLKLEITFVMLRMYHCILKHAPWIVLDSCNGYNQYLEVTQGSCWKLSAI